MAGKRKEVNEIDELYQQIIEEYENTKSIAQIAKKLNVTQVKVQRTLITEGLWTSKRTEQIAELRALGLSTEEIAEKLGKDVKTIQTFLPYSRGQYGRSETSEASRSKDYRDRMHAAAEKMITKEAATMNNYEYNDMDMKLEKSADTVGNNTIPHTEEELKRNPFLNKESVFRLKLELVNHFIYGGGDYFEDEPEEKKDFLRLAKAKEGISREVLVPSTMNLHAMHYMIQRLFGWQNSHLHNFSISEDDFNRLTKGTVGGWKKLCGGLLHYSSDEGSDFYWDDDYKEAQSVKSWLKRKYVGPYLDKAVCDTYYGAQKGVKDFFKHVSEFNDSMTIKEMYNRVYIEESLNFLSERLTLGELLVKNVPDNDFEKEKAYRDWIKNLDAERQKLDDIFAGMGAKKLREIDEAVEGLKRWRTNKSRVEHDLYYRDGERILEQTGRSADEWLYDAYYFIPRFERQCQKLFTEYNPKIKPLFDTLYYEYDYGDGWCIKITVIDQYDRKTNADLSTNGWFVVDIMQEKDKLAKYRYFQDGKEVDEDLRSVLAYVDAKERPRCVASDGLYVLDDVAGIGGFHEMLKTLESGDLQEKKEMLTWARGLGWTGKMNKLENML